MATTIYNVEQLAKILGFTVPAIHAHLARENFEAVPPPIRLGRKLAWTEELVDSWIQAKIARLDQSPPYILKQNQAYTRKQPKVRGRKRKETK